MKSALTTLGIGLMAFPALGALEPVTLKVFVAVVP